MPYGGATSIEGHTLSPNGGVCIDMSSMKVCSTILIQKENVTISLAESQKHCVNEFQFRSM